MKSSKPEGKEAKGAKAVNRIETQHVPPAKGSPRCTPQWLPSSCRVNFKPKTFSKTLTLTSTVIFLCHVSATSQKPSRDVSWVHSAPATPCPWAAHEGTVLAAELGMALQDVLSLDARVSGSAPAVLLRVMFWGFALLRMPLCPHPSPLPG